MPTPREEMRVVSARLKRIGIPFAFVGGAVMWVLVDHPEVTQFRRTKDVDVIVAVMTYSEYAALEQRLRDEGFIHDISPGAPMCRWVVDGCRVDVMPEKPASLGMNTRWFPEALAQAQITDLGGGVSAPVVTGPLFLATKMEAFKDRGKSDYYMSHDIEDIVTLVDGRSSIVQDVAGTEIHLRGYLCAEFSKMIAHPDFGDALHGHLTEKQRIPLVKSRFKAIAELGAASEPT